MIISPILLYYQHDRYDNIIDNLEGGWNCDFDLWFAVCGLWFAVCVLLGELRGFLDWPGDKNKFMG